MQLDTGIKTNKIEDFELKDQTSTSVGGSQRNSNLTNVNISLIPNCSSFVLRINVDEADVKTLETLLDKLRDFEERLWEQDKEDWVDSMLVKSWKQRTGDDISEYDVNVFEVLCDDCNKTMLLRKEKMLTQPWDQPQPTQNVQDRSFTPLNQEINAGPQVLEWIRNRFHYVNSQKSKYKVVCRYCGSTNLKKLKERIATVSGFVFPSDIWYNDGNNREGEFISDFVDEDEDFEECCITIKGKNPDEDLIAALLDHLDIKWENISF